MIITNVEGWMAEQVQPSSHINIFTAFFTSKGWVTLFDVIDQLAPAQGACCIIVGMQTGAKGNLANLASIVDEVAAVGVKRVIAKDLLKHGISSSEKERMLAQIGTTVDIRISDVPSHEKMFLIDNGFIRRAVVGSSNLTASGLKPTTQKEMCVTLSPLDVCRVSIRFQKAWESALPISDAIYAVLMGEDASPKTTPSLYAKSEVAQKVDALLGRWL